MNDAIQEYQSDSGERFSQKPAGNSIYLVMTAVLLAEVALVAAGVRAILNPGLLLVSHLAIVIAATAALRKPIFGGGDDGAALLGMLATLATGPFGSAGALIFMRFQKRSVVSEALLAAWYQRISLSAEQDTFTKLSDRVAIGRSANLAAPAPQPFADLFRSNDLPGQQVALGLIARAFSPAYLPILKTALDSPEAVIRVQAAAVAARVRSPLRTHVLSLFDQAASPTLSPAAALDIAADLHSTTASGLLEESDRIRAVGIQEALLARVFARLDSGISNGGTERHSRESSDAYADYLLRQGRFDEFRAARFAFRRPTHGRYRRRLVIARPLGPHVSVAALAVRR